MWKLGHAIFLSRSSLWKLGHAIPVALMLWLIESSVRNVPGSLLLHSPWLIARIALTSSSGAMWYYLVCFLPSGLLDYSQFWLHSHAFADDELGFIYSFISYNLEFNLSVGLWEIWYVGLRWCIGMLDFGPLAWFCFADDELRCDIIWYVGFWFTGLFLISDLSLLAPFCCIC